MLLEPACWVLRLVLPCISQADPHLEPSLPAGGARVELSPGAAASVESQITWQRAVIQRTSQCFLPGDSVPFIFPGTCPAPLAGAWHSGSALPSCALIPPRTAGPKGVSCWGPRCLPGTRLWNKQSCFCGCKVKTRPDAVSFCSWLG